jgi:hypothetical protein
VIQERRKPFSEIANQIGIDASDKVLRKALDNHGLHRRLAREVSFLTTAQKQARKAWGRINRDRNWKPVTWSDECYIQHGDKPGQVFVTRRAGEEFDENCVIPSFKQSSVRVMVWGWIALDWKGPLVILEYPGGHGGGMTAARYVEQVLEAHVGPLWDHLRAERPELAFQQDSAPCHTAKLVKRWFAQKNIPLFPHPPNSPDLSPLEPVWHELKQRIRARRRRPTTVAELREAILEEWDAMLMEDINKHIRSMPERVKAVLRANGGHTKY